MPWDYSEKVLQLFKAAVQGEPGTHMGEVENPDGLGEHGSIACGDALRFSFRVKRHPSDPHRDVITQARYLTFGCTSAIAASEALCRVLEEGAKTPIQALQVTNQDLIDFLGGLPEQKIHCSVMGAEALQAAVIDWARRRGVDLSEILPRTEVGQSEDRIVCRCFSISESYLRRKIPELHLRSLAQITNALKAGGGCGSCRYEPGGLQDLLDDQWCVTPTAANERQRQAGESPEIATLSPFQLGRKIEEALETTARPMLCRDGGGVELVDVRGDQVFCRLTGACAACATESQALKLWIEQQLKEQVDEKLKVTLV